MSGPAASGPRSGGGSDPKGAPLSAELISKLSDQEKAARDHELLAQAERYFGGLSGAERIQLGLGGTEAADVQRQAGTEPDPVGGPSADPGRTPSRPSFLGQEYFWAAVAAGVFAAVVWWVVAAS